MCVMVCLLAINCTNYVFNFYCCLISDGEYQLDFCESPTTGFALNLKQLKGVSVNGVLNKVQSGLSTALQNQHRMNIEMNKRTLK